MMKTTRVMLIPFVWLAMMRVATDIMSGETVHSVLRYITLDLSEETQLLEAQAQLELRRQQG